MIQSTSTYKPPTKYDGGGDLLKRWYIEYYQWCPRNSKYIRHREYSGINRIHDRYQRLKALEELYLTVCKRLKRGDIHFRKSQSIAIQEAVELALSIKKGFQLLRGYESTKYHLGSFLKYLKKNGLDNAHLSEFSRSDITAFLNDLLSRGLSRRSWNNHLIDIKAFFNLMIREEKLGHNPCAGILPLKARSDTHVAFTETELLRMKSWMDLNDPYLSLFCKFIGYAFLRPAEIMRLRIRNIDLDRKLIVVPESMEKTGQKKYKMIQELFWPEIEKLQLQQYPPDYFLFTNSGEPGLVAAGKNHFSSRFSKMKKELHLSRKQTMYGIRHTYVAMLLESGAKIHHVMGLTGHESISSFEKYARSLMGAPRHDLSASYSVKI